MKIITIRKRRYSVPENWDEMTAPQLLQVMEALFVKPFTMEQLLLHLVKVLTGMTTYQFLRCDVEELDEFTYLVAFLLMPELSFTKNLFPVVYSEGEAYYGPSDSLNNLRMKEFTFTENLFMSWCAGERQDVTQLDELVAILYRPAKPKYDHVRNPDGDPREDYNQNICSWRAQHHVKQWPLDTKLAIAHWYDGCRRHIVNINEDVFGGSGDLARYGLVSVMLDVAESHVFGDFTKVEEQHVNLVMMQLQQLIDKAKKIESQSQP